MEQNKENTSSLLLPLPYSLWISASMFLNFQIIFLSAEYPEWLLFLQNFFPLLPL